MAINLDSIVGGQIDFGDIAAIGGLPEMTIAFTWRIDTTQDGISLFTQWGVFGPGTSWLCQVVGDELGWGVHNPGLSGRKTTGVNLTNGIQYRILITWTGSLPLATATHFWVNGVDEAQNTWFGAANPATLKDVTTHVFLAHSLLGVSFGGDRSEIAIWDHVVPDWFSIAYGFGASPDFYRRGGIGYWKLRSTKQVDLVDQWGRGRPSQQRNDGVNIGGTNAPHPRMYYPAPSPTRMAFPPLHISPPHIDDASVSIRETQDASVSIGEAVDDSVSIRETEDATV